MSAEGNSGTLTSPWVGVMERGWGATGQETSVSLAGQHADRPLLTNGERKQGSKSFEKAETYWD